MHFRRSLEGQCKSAFEQPDPGCQILLSRSVDRGDKSDVNTRAKPPLIVIIKRALCVLGKIHDGGPIWGFRDTGYLKRNSGISNLKVFTS